MSRKVTLAVAAVLALMTAPAFAHGGHGGGHGGHGGGMGGMHAGGHGGGHGGHGGHMGGHGHGHGHYHNHHKFVRIWWGGRYWVRPVGYIAPVAVSSPGPCTCLTKSYTTDGAVIFKDLCTQETATNQVAPAAPQQSSENAAPSNFAGKTYQDFLAANQGQTQQN